VLLIPAIDLREGRCVRLYQGDFARATQYSPTSAVLLGRYEALGASWVHVVDLDGARSGQRNQRSLICGLAPLTSVSLQVGGGIRSGADVEALLSAGVQRVVIGSAAVEHPHEVLGWLREFGAERICLAFDVRIAGGVPQIRTQGWTHPTGASLWDAVGRYSGHARHVLCTDIARDGTLVGPNIDLYREAVLRFPQFQWQASGGVRHAADLQALETTGVNAAISGKALLEERISVSELRPFLPVASSPASTSATASS
jgi:phosphoribosylformimino-5-aminoimidazole carboxamide ribotide isomerase